jgi:hypothetical protein
MKLDGMNPAPPVTRILLDTAGDYVFGVSGTLGKFAQDFPDLPGTCPETSQRGQFAW